MKTFLISSLCYFCSCFVFAQTFMNGDFETTTASGCDYNLSDSLFNTKVPNVFAFGKKYAGPVFGYIGETDIQTNGCYITPQSGSWCLGLSSDSTFSSDAVALELTSLLLPGQTYQLSFYVFSNSNFSLSVSNLMIGASATNTTFGYQVANVVPLPNMWKQVVFNFSIPLPCKYITVTTTSGIKGWNQIDNFKIGSTTGLSDLASSEISFFPNPCTSILTITTLQRLKDASVIFYNSLGQKVKTIDQLNGQTFTFNRDVLQSDIYTIEISEGNSLILRRKLIITD